MTLPLLLRKCQLWCLISGYESYLAETSSREHNPREVTGCKISSHTEKFLVLHQSGTEVLSPTHTPKPLSPKGKLCVKFMPASSAPCWCSICLCENPCLGLSSPSEKPSLSMEWLKPSGVTVLVRRAENIISEQPTEDMPMAHKGNIKAYRLSAEPTLYTVSIELGKTVTLKPRLGGYQKLFSADVDFWP